MKKLLLPILSVLVALAVALPLGMLHAAQPPGWPDCDWNCTANDVQIIRVWFSGDNFTGDPLPQCDPPAPVNAYIWAEIYNGTGTDRYAVWLIFDLYIDGSPSGSRVVECVTEMVEAGTTYVWIYGPVLWTCGEEVQLRGPSDLGGPVISWSTNVEPCSPPPTACTSRRAQSYCAPPLIVAAPLVADFTTNSPQCCCTIDFTDATTGGIEPYEYTWDFDDGNVLGPGLYPNPSHTYGTPGTYDVTLTVEDSDAPPKSDSQTHSVTVYALPVAAASNSGPVCPGEDVTLYGDPDGMTTYHWTGPGLDTLGQDVLVSPAVAGLYTLEVTDANGCSDTDTTSVVINTPPVAAASNSGPVCPGDDVTLYGDPDGMTTYHWTGPGLDTLGQDVLVSPAVAGLYTLEVTDANGCSDTATTSVVINTPPVAAASNSGPVCPGEDVTLYGDPDGMTTYHWTGPGLDTLGQDVLVSPAVAGLYTLEVTDANGCSDTDTTSVVINAGPTANAGDDKEILCGAASVQLDGSASGGTGPYLYSWDPPAGLSDPNSQTPTASAAGTYTLTVTDANGCTGTDEVTVTVIGAPTADAGPDEAICPGSSVGIGGDPTASGGTSPYTYSWTPTTGLDDATIENPTASPATTTIYSVLVTDVDGCEAVDSVTVTVYDPPTADAGPDVSILDGGSTPIGGSPTASGGTSPYTYSWSPATGLSSTTAANPTASPAATTTYTVVVTDDNGCQDSDSATVTVTTVAEADVAVTKSDNPDPVTAGHLLTYTVRVTNNGPVAAEGVLLTDDIPDEILDPEYSLDGGFTWNPWPGSLSLGTMSAGQSRQVLIRGIVDPSFLGQFCNTAMVSSTTPDSNLTNNQDTECTNVIAIPGCTLEITCPADVTVECDESTDPANTGSATAIGNCEPEVTYSDSVSGTCPTIITRTWTATDTGGNLATCTQIITVVDITPPVLTVPPDVTVGYGQPTDVSHTGGWATAIDNCDPDPEITYSDTEGVGCCAITIVRLWTATDACGNSSSAAQTIKVTDVTPPVITVPDDVTIEYGMSLPPANTGGWATAIDNFDPSPTIIYRDSSSGACPVVITRTWTATDYVGNSASAVQIITLVDNLAPELTVPADATIEFGQSTNPFNAGGWAAAIDNFDASPEIAYSDSSTGTCPMTITRSWTATDCCGNSASAVQTIMVVDTTAPILSVPVIVAVECGESTDPSNTGWAMAVDNFDLSPEVTYSDSSSGACPTTIIRTWTATDSCGHSASVEQTITVGDNTRPVLTLPGDISIGEGDSTDLSKTGQATAVDAGDASVTLTYEDISAGDVIIRIWTATDDSGNSISGIQRITVSDGGLTVWQIALIALGGLLAILLLVFLARRERLAPGGF